MTTENELQRADMKKRLAKLGLRLVASKARPIITDNVVFVKVKSKKRPRK